MAKTNAQTSGYSLKRWTEILNEKIFHLVR